MCWASGGLMDAMRIKSNTGAHEFEIASNDREHLEIIAQTIGGNYGLRKVSRVPNATKSPFVASRCTRTSWLTAVRRTSREQLDFHTFRRNFCRTSCVVLLMEMEHCRGMGIGLSSSLLRLTLFLNGLITAIAQGTGIPAPMPQANRENWTVKWSTIRAKCLAAWLYTIIQVSLLRAKPHRSTISRMAARRSLNRDHHRRNALNFPAYLP